ncbi:MAG: hypothetical protein N2654_02765 [Deltaproteobacteria bacterium]|nr:hypothetical protein [Deltaproteobacteria bacterium]
MRTVFLFLFMAGVLADVICRDANGLLRWQNSTKCPTGLKKLNVSKLSNFNLNGPFPYVILSGYVTQSFASTGTQYMSVFGGSQPSNSQSVAFANIFNCKRFRIEIQTTSNSNCTSSSLRRFRLWNTETNSVVGSGQIDLAPGDSGELLTVSSNTPAKLALQTQMVTGNCPNSAKWVLFCR